MKGNHKHGHNRHGARSREYAAWNSMKTRCSNKNHQSYKRYGLNGISFCQSWESFENFLDDMGPIPSRFHSLDRFPDMAGNYEPGNCRWATRKQQSDNRKSVVLYPYSGKMMPIRAIAAIVGIKAKTIKDRFMNLGWDFQMAISTPTGNNARNRQPFFIPHSFGYII